MPDYQQCQILGKPWGTISQIDLTGVIGDLAADDDEGDCEQRDDDQEDHEEGAHVQPPLQAQLAGVGQGVQAGLT